MGVSLWNMNMNCKLSKLGGQNVNTLSCVAGNDGCQYFNDCCMDYHAYCGAASQASPDPPAPWWKV